MYWLNLKSCNFVLVKVLEHLYFMIFHICNRMGKEIYIFFLHKRNRLNIPHEYAATYH